VNEHPIAIVLEKAMDEQPNLTMLGTHHPRPWVERYGANRVVHTPIAENAMLGMAVGMALTGRRVLADVGRAAFLYSAMDPLVNQATKWRYQTNGQYSVPLLITAITRDGENAGSQHEHAPHAALSQIPGLVVAVPSSVKSTAGLMAYALTYPDPVVILESSRVFLPTWATDPDPEPTFDPIPFGVAHRIRDGQDVTLVGIGNTVPVCLAAAGHLAEQGIAAQVVDLRTAAPLDREGVAGLASTTSGVVLVDEAIGPCSLVRDLGFHLVTSGAMDPHRVRAVSGAPCPVPASPVLQRVTLPGPNRVVAAVRELLDPVSVS
jgi:pyruvate/2-oxoglutarate/acetoin dehydrogenase E1 component